MAQTKFGVSQIRNPSPRWAKWMFRIVFLITTALAAWIAATNIFPQATKYEITLFLKIVVDPIILGISEMCGVSLQEKKRRQ